MTQWLRGRLMAVLIAAALTGAALAAIASFAMPGRYRSATVLRAPSPQSMRDMQQTAFRRTPLRAVIEQEGLYQRELAQSTMEDAIEKMQADIEVRYLNSPGLYTVRFVYQDAAGARRALRALLEKISVFGLTVVSPPDLPGRPVGLTHLEMAGAGLVGGLLVALLAAGAWLSSRIRVAAAAALAGAGLGAAVWFALPKTYVSTARIAITGAAGADRAAASKSFLSVWAKVVPGSLGVIVNRRLSNELASGKPLPELLAELQKRISVSPVDEDEFAISVTHRDRYLAQVLAAELVRMVIDEDARMRYAAWVQKEKLPPAPAADLFSGIEMIAPRNLLGELDSPDPSAKFSVFSHMLDRVSQLAKSSAPGNAVESRRKAAPPKELPAENERGFKVPDPASLPQAPASPNRLVVILVWLAAGLLLGVAAPALRRSPATAVGS